MGFRGLQVSYLLPHFHVHVFNKMEVMLWTGTQRQCELEDVHSEISDLLCYPFHLSHIIWERECVKL